jgi:hypothetical protein
LLAVQNVFPILELSDGILVVGENKPTQLPMGLQKSVRFPIKDAPDGIEAENAIPKFQDIFRLPYELPLKSRHEVLVFPQQFNELFDFEILSSDVPVQV